MCASCVPPASVLPQPCAAARASDGATAHGATVGAAGAGGGRHALGRGGAGVGVGAGAALRVLLDVRKRAPAEAALRGVDDPHWAARGAGQRCGSNPEFLSAHAVIDLLFVLLLVLSVNGVRRCEWTERQTGREYFKWERTLLPDGSRQPAPVFQQQPTAGLRTPPWGGGASGNQAGPTMQIIAITFSLGHKFVCKDPRRQNTGVGFLGSCLGGSYISASNFCEHFFL